MQTIEKKEYRFHNPRGDAELTVYQVFPGVELAYSSVRMDHFDPGEVMGRNMIEIHHCREGRLEHSFGDEHLCLMPGDFSISLGNTATRAFRYPLRHYHGITIGIREDMARQWQAGFMEDIPIQPLEVTRRLCGSRYNHIIPNDERIGHIFVELYRVPEHIRKGFFKLKITELFLVLSGMDECGDKVTQCMLPQSQIQLANTVAAYLSGHMDQHITIPELARQFHVSDTQLKNAFKGVYGMPIFSYMRMQKMQAAARLLIQTEKSIADIANEFGYKNTSKFSAAFHAVIGDHPGAYRKRYPKPSAP